MIVLKLIILVLVYLIFWKITSFGIMLEDPKTRDRFLEKLDSFLGKDPDTEK